MSGDEREPTERPDLDELLDDDERSQREYVDGLIERGEAAEPDEHGELPPGATHELVKKRPGEAPEVRRRRFSLG